MMCDEDLSLDKDKFKKLMKTSPQETEMVFYYFINWPIENLIK